MLIKISNEIKWKLDKKIESKKFCSALFNKKIEND